MTQNKLGGAHIPQSLAAEIVSGHPMAKRIIPSVISVKGAAGGKTVARVLRYGARGNLHLLISSGTSAQELRIVTTVGNFLAEESLRCELNEMLSDALDW